MSGTLPPPDDRLFIPLHEQAVLLKGNETMNPKERTVSKQFRDVIFERYPALSNLPYAALFCYCCFGTAKDDSFGALLIPSRLLASFEEKQGYHKSKNYSGREFLSRFQSDTGIMIHVSSYDSESHSCRMVLAFVLPEDIEALVEQERRNMWIRQERVYFVDGRKHNPKRQRGYYSRAQSEAMELITGSGCGSPIHEDSRKIGTYLNQLPRTRFSKIMEHWQEAMEFAKQMQGSVNKHGTDNTKEVRRHNLNILQAIKDEPHPLYQPSRNGKTVRLFSYNQSLLSLSRDVRKIMTQDWYEADLRSSQLAIVGRQWEIPSVVEFLKTGTSVWKHFCEELEIDYSQGNKDALKTALYATIFGMKPSYVSYQLNRALKAQNTGKNMNYGRRFIQCDLMQELIKARERKVAQIITNEGDLSCYGEWLSLKEFDQEDGANSILAQNAQAMEMQILSPVFDLAMTDTRFQIMLFQHDGFCYTVEDHNRAEHYQKLITEIIRQSCSKLQVESFLEIEQPIRKDKELSSQADPG